MLFVFCLLNQPVFWFGHQLPAGTASPLKVTTQGFVDLGKLAAFLKEAIFPKNRNELKHPWDENSEKLRNGKEIGILYTAYIIWMQNIYICYMMSYVVYEFLFQKLLVA